ncbi:MAG: CBS domain-containing protein [Ruthenibacterium lactatiformans]
MAEGKKMRVDDLFITEDISVLDAMRKLDETGLGVLFVAPEGVLRAVVTDGDIRRYILKSLPLEGPVREAANYSPYALPMRRGRGPRPLLEHGIGALPLLDKAGQGAGRGVRGQAGHRHIKKHARPWSSWRAVWARVCIPTPKYCPSP